MNIYNRKHVSNILLSERLTAELRLVFIELQKLQNTISVETHNLQEILRKQNSIVSIENIRNAIGTSKSAVITFSKIPSDSHRAHLPHFAHQAHQAGNSHSVVAGDRLPPTQTLYVRNMFSQKPLLRNSCVGNKNKSFTISTTAKTSEIATGTSSMRTFDFNSARKKVRFHEHCCQLRRTLSDCHNHKPRKSTFDYVKCENNEVAKTSLMVYRLEKVFISELQKIYCQFENIRAFVGVKFNQKSNCFFYLYIVAF